MRNKIPKSYSVLFTISCSKKESILQKAFAKEIDEVFQLEAKGIMSDLATSPTLLGHFINFDENDRQRAIGYIRSILEECYSEGHLKVAIFHEKQQLYGYAVFFKTSNPEYPVYLHKIFVKESYRNAGLGGQLLQSVINDSPKIALLCPMDKVAFYEKYSFHYSQPFEVPDNERFKLSRDLYSDLCLMKNYQDSSEIPLFFLNDGDLKKIVGL